MSNKNPKHKKKITEEDLKKHLEERNKKVVEKDNIPTFKPKKKVEDQVVKKDPDTNVHRNKKGEVVIKDDNGVYKPYTPQQQPEIKQGSNIKSPFQIYKENEKTQKEVKEKVLKKADVITDVMQAGKAVPHPLFQTIGNIGGVLGSGIDAYQAYTAAKEGNYGEVSINAASAVLPAFLGNKTFLRNSKYSSIAPELNEIFGDQGRTTYLNLRKQVRKQSPEQLMYNRALVGTLGAETIYDTQYSMGGNLKQQTNNNNMLNEFNEGGSHEQNPLGGIPQGMGQNGQMNTVEEGETKKDNFIYSDRIKLTPELVSQFNLPKVLANKTAAEATKIINTKFEGRNSTIDNSTKKAMLDRIAEAQETIKQVEAQKQAEIAEALNMNSTMDPEDQMGGEIPQGMEEFLPQEQMMYGGRINQNQMFFGGNSQQGEMAGEFASQIGIQAADMIAPGSGQFLKMGEQFGTQIGSLIGDKKGEQIGQLINPMGTIKGLGTALSTGNLNDIPGIGIFGGKTTKQKELDKIRLNQDLLSSNSKISNFAFGGNINDPKKNSLQDIATKKDTMFVQKYSQDKKKDLLNKGYIKQEGFKRDKGYSDVHKLNDDALKMLWDDWNNGKRRDIVDLNNNRLSKVFDPNFYQRPHENNPNVYYNLEGANALGVINPNANYLAFDRRINPNIKSNWINPKTGDGVELYEYDFGSKYDTPTPKSNKTKTSGKSSIVNQTKKTYTNSNVSKKPTVNPNQISPVSSGYKFAMGGNMYNDGGGLTDPTKPWMLPKSTIADDPNLSGYGTVGFRKTFNGVPYSKELPLDQQIDIKSTYNPETLYKQSFNQMRKPLVSNEIGFKSKLNYNDPVQENNGTVTARTFGPQPNGHYEGEMDNGSKLENVLNKTGQYLKDNYGNILRYSPVAMNALQLHKLNKSGYDTVDPMINNTRYNPQYMDEKALVNQINAESNYAGNALANASNGSMGALRSNILASQLAKTKGLSDAYSRVAESNRNENKTGQQFNLGVDEANIARRIAAEDKTAMNKGNWETNKSRLLGQIGTDLGNIGLEQERNNMAEAMTGYTRRGKYLYKDDGTRVSADELKSTINNTMSSIGVTEKDGKYFDASGKELTSADVLKMINSKNTTNQNRFGGYIMSKNFKK